MNTFKQFFTEALNGFTNPPPRAKFKIGDIVLVKGVDDIGFAKYHPKKVQPYQHQVGVVTGYKNVPGAYTKYSVKFDDGAEHAVHSQFLFGPYSSKEEAVKFTKGTVGDIRNDKLVGVTLKSEPEFERFIVQEVQQAPFNFKPVTPRQDEDYTDPKRVKTVLAELPLPSNIAPLLTPYQNKGEISNLSIKLYRTNSVKTGNISSYGVELPLLNYNNSTFNLAGGAQIEGKDVKGGKEGPKQRFREILERNKTKMKFFNDIVKNGGETPPSLEQSFKEIVAFVTNYFSKAPFNLTLITPPQQKVVELWGEERSCFLLGDRKPLLASSISHRAYTNTNANSFELILFPGKFAIGINIVTPQSVNAGSKYDDPINTPFVFASYSIQKDYSGQLQSLSGSEIPDSIIRSFLEFDKWEEENVKTFKDAGIDDDDIQSIHDMI